MKNRTSIFFPIFVALFLLTLLIGIASAADNQVDPLTVTAVTEIKSDDYNQQTLAPFWTHTEGAMGDPAPVMNGSEVEITVEQGIDHDIYPPGGNKSSRIMQPVPDSDFEVEVKFNSVVSETYQMQGILVEQDSNNFLRMEFFGQNGNTYALAAEFDNDIFIQRGKSLIAPGDTVPLYLRVKRQGNDWTHSLSADGNVWTTFVTFTRTMTVNSVGIYAANAGGSPPEHTTVADYFINTANPGPFTLMLTEVGNGNVTKNPDLASFHCEIA